MQRHEIANKLIEIGYKLTSVTEYDDLVFEKVWKLGNITLWNEVAIFSENNGGKIEARKFINGEAERVDGDEYIIQHDYDLVHITDGIMWTDDERVFPL